MATDGTKQEEEGITNLTVYMNEILEESEPEKSEIEKARDEGTKYMETTLLKDDLENTVYIPGGFHVSEDSATKVEGGIVIEDDYGNQFVWIPTGEYKVSTILSPTGTLTNELTTRQWGTTKDIVKEPTLIAKDEVAEGNQGAYYYGEGDNRSCTIIDGVNSINVFLSSAKPVNEGGKGGFYIGRYEQGTGNVCKAGIDAYVDVTRDEARSQAEAMYSGRSDIKVKSQLISSYAWDTVLNYICQTNVGEGKGYALATTTSQDRANIGTGNKTQTGGYLEDCYSNIYDFLGNCREWTTEYSSASDSYSVYTCVGEGGLFCDNGFCAALRSYAATSYSSSNDSFRLQLVLE